MLLTEVELHVLPLLVVRQTCPLPVPMHTVEAEAMPIVVGMPEMEDESKTAPDERTINGRLLGVRPIAHTPKAPV